MTKEYNGVVVKIMKYINALPNGKAINIHGSVYSEKGTPDIIGCIGSKFVAFECKKKGGKPTEIQEYRIQQWRKAGAIAHIVYSFDEAKRVLDILQVLQSE